tara:strand:- start:930 stop:1970 length:1041 start_codon:yes stop_codon:yes gene_type:complete
VGSGIIAGACCCADVIDEPDDDECDLDCENVNYNVPLQVGIVGGGRFAGFGGGYPEGTCTCSQLGNPNCPPQGPCGVGCTAALDMLDASGCEIPTSSSPNGCLCGASTGNRFTVTNIPNIAASGTLLPVPNQPCEDIWFWEGNITVNHPIGKFEWHELRHSPGGSVCQHEALWCPTGTNMTIVYECEAMCNVYGSNFRRAQWDFIGWPNAAAPNHIPPLYIFGEGLASEGWCRGISTYMLGPPYPNQGMNIHYDIQDMFNSHWSGLHGRREAMFLPQFKASPQGSCGWNTYDETVPVIWPPPAKVEVHRNSTDYLKGSTGCGYCAILSDICQEVRDRYWGAISIGV